MKKIVQTQEQEHLETQLQIQNMQNTLNSITTTIEIFNPDLELKYLLFR